MAGDYDDHVHLTAEGYRRLSLELLAHIPEPWLEAAPER
jgi:lysophospholipase L1-like esterase